MIGYGKLVYVFLFFSDSIDEWCLDVYLSYVVIGCVKLVCVFCFAVYVNDWRLTLILVYVLICYVKFVCVFVLPLALMMCV